MPSVKVLEQKKQAVCDLIEKLKGSVSGVVVDYKGITVADDTKLRRELREANVEYSIVKNTLMRFAIKEAGLEGLEGVLEGTTALAVSKDDQTAPARILTKFAEESKGSFSIKAGYIDGDVYNDKDVIAIGKLPTRDQLLGQLLSVLNGNIRGLACALNAIAEKDGEQAAE